MELEKRAVEQIVYDDDIADPEEETPTGEDEAAMLPKGVARHAVPADEAMAGEDF